MFFFSFFLLSLSSIFLFLIFFIVPRKRSRVTSGIYNRRMFFFYTSFTLQRRGESPTCIIPQLRYILKAPHDATSDSRGFFDLSYNILSLEDRLSSCELCSIRKRLRDTLAKDDLLFYAYNICPFLGKIRTFRPM